MAIFKRVADVAKSNFEAIKEGLSGRDLEDFTDEELLAELERRKLERAEKQEAEARGERRPTPTAGAPAATPAAARAPLDELGKAYASLELQRGADLEMVKAQYRKLIRVYHPDRHAGDPEKHRLAVELAQKLTRAYMKIRSHLEKG